MEISDKDYIEYLRGMGSWTKDQELLWSYLSGIMGLLSEISGKIDQKKENNELIGKFKINPQPQTGSLPSKVARSDYSSSRLSPN